ncbi:hypothetical protein HGB25_01850 [Candidatus Saccharibacteria bacterium]|nr:hypothetical protein [Candidatus Saccharibacteria bacterium]
MRSPNLYDYASKGQPINKKNITDSIDYHEEAYFNIIPKDKHDPRITYNSLDRQFTVDKNSVKYSQTCTQKILSVGKKPKVLERLPGVACLDLTRWVFENNDVIFVMDTNTIDIAGEQISSSTVIQITPEKYVNTDLIQARSKSVIQFFFSGVAGGIAEKRAWLYLINIVMRSAKYRSTTRFSIVTDHDIANHEEYNNHIFPIWGIIFLPKNWRLAYAKDQPVKGDLGKLIRECENLNKKTLKSLKLNGTADIDGKVINLNEVLAKL